MEMTNTLAYYDTATITAVKCFIVQSPGIYLIKLFSTKFTHTFCELDHLINLSNICYIAMQWSNLQKECVNLCQKGFKRSKPGVCGTTYTIDFDWL